MRCFLYSYLGLAALFLGSAPNAFSADVRSLLTYKSTVTNDANGPLDLTMEINYNDARPNAPIAVVMHQFTAASGNFEDYRENAQRLRDQGFVVLTVAMRGRDGSDGVRDSGGVEIYDIYDAVEHVKATMPAFVDRSSVYITGYSGGGGNVFSAVTKFPDYFRAASSFFGMSDYGYNATNGWYNNGAGGRVSTLNTDIGNPNTGGNAVRDKYMARASNLAAKNNPYTEIHLFANNNETICPPINNTSYRDSAVAAATTTGQFDNITVHLGLPNTYRDFDGDGVNDPNELQWWPHQAPTAEQQHAGEAWFIDRLKSGAIAEPVLLKNDELFVAGYVKTKPFSLWLGDGQNAAADLDYSLSSEEKVFQLEIASSNLLVTGKLTVETADFSNASIQVLLNGTVIDTIARGGAYTYPNLKDNDVLKLKAVPEPATAALALLGGVALSSIRRRSPR